MATILVTGANRGIGLQLVENFLTDGHRVIATTRDLSRANSLNQLKEKFGDLCTLLILDITQDSSVKQVARQCNDLGNLDWLINNAGALIDAEQTFAGLDLTDVERSLNVNTLGAMRLTQALLPLLKASSQAKVVSIGSKMGSITENTSGGYYGYRVSKAALNMFNRSFATDYPAITAVVMHPGWVQTDMGGLNAPVSVAESARGLCRIITELTPRDSGRFIDFQGKEIPW